MKRQSNALMAANYIDCEGRRARFCLVTVDI